MPKLKLLCSAILLASATLLQGCSGDCARASDCAADEVCYNEICQKASSPFFDQTCQMDSDCDGDGDGQTEFFCELGRCRLRNTMPVVIPDSGVTDTGVVPDSGVDTGVTDTGVDSGITDTGVTDTGTTTGADN